MTEQSQPTEKFSRTSWIVLQAASWMLGLVLAFFFINQINALVFPRVRSILITSQFYSLAYVTLDYLIAGALFGLAAAFPTWYLSRDSMKLPGTWAAWTAVGGAITFLLTPDLLVPFLMNLVSPLIESSGNPSLQIVYLISQVPPNIAIARSPQAIWLAPLLGLLVGAFFGLWIGLGQGISWSLGRRQFGRWLLMTVIATGIAGVLIAAIAQAVLTLLSKWNVSTFVNVYYLRILIPADGLINGVLFGLLTAPLAERYSAEIMARDAEELAAEELAEQNPAAAPAEEGLLAEETPLDAAPGAQTYDAETPALDQPPADLPQDGKPPEPGQGNV